MRIYIVRHAERSAVPLYNEKLNIQNEPITEKGEKQAAALVACFKDVEIKRIVASQYLRAYQTALYVAQDKGLSIQRDFRLNEINNGDIRSMSTAEIQQKYPELWADFISGTRDVRFPNGESGEDVRLRQKSLLDELIANDEDVLLFSHEGYMRLLMCQILGLPVWRRGMFYIDYCGLIELEYNKEQSRWKIIRCNQMVKL